MLDIANEYLFTVKEVKEFYDKCGGDAERTRSRFRTFRELLSQLPDYHVPEPLPPVQNGQPALTCQLPQVDQSAVNHISASNPPPQPNQVVQGQTHEMPPPSQAPPPNHTSQVAQLLNMSQSTPAVSML